MKRKVPFLEREIRRKNHKQEAKHQPQKKDGRPDLSPEIFLAFTITTEIGPVQSRFTLVSVQKPPCTRW